MSPLVQTFLVVLGWFALLWRMPRRVGPRPSTGLDVDPGAVRSLAWSCLAVAAVRGLFACDRGLGRNVDEFWYAGLARFSASSGEGLLACMRNLRLHAFLYTLTGGESLWPVDALVCVVTGATAFLLGLLVLRHWGDRRAAALIAPLGFLGTIRFEGLTSCAEQTAGLFLTLYLLVRLWAPAAEGSWKRHLAAGACLGLAGLMKEQTLPCVLLEPLFALVVRPAAGRPRALAVARRLCWAALGFWVPFGGFVLLLAVGGQLGRFVEELWGFALAGGNPFDIEGHGAVERATRPHAAAVEGPVGLLGGGVLWLKVLSGNYARLLLSPVSFLGVVGAGLVRLEPPGPRRQVLKGLLVFALVTGAVASLGRRWFPHYFLLMAPAWTVLAALLLARAARSLAQKRGRPWTLLLLGAALLTAGLEVRFLYRSDETWPGFKGFPVAHRPDLLEAARAVRSVCPPERPLFVAGWRPELYYLTERDPATRFFYSFPISRVIADLEARPPGAVVFPTWNGVGMDRVVIDPRAEQTVTHRLAKYTLERDEVLMPWLEERGYALRSSRGGYLVYAPASPREGSRR